MTEINKEFLTKIQDNVIVWMDSMMILINTDVSNVPTIAFPALIKLIVKLALRMLID